jgi:hypothetical protein
LHVDASCFWQTPPTHAAAGRHAGPLVASHAAPSAAAAWHVPGWPTIGILHVPLALHTV